MDRETLIKAGLVIPASDITVTQFNKAVAKRKGTHKNQAANRAAHAAECNRIRDLRNSNSKGGK